MKLTGIKLAGFKSFVDPTHIKLVSNLTGIVGPNGCGKSNVIDAVRWVMGESSAKHLRGDSISDVIFNGTTTRKPVNQASVELIFDNSETTLTGNYATYSEISIKRILNQEGVSTYYINGTRCRRKDITEIFLGTGLGPRSYAIIEQGMISRIIEAKPHEMRVYLEEAAGISKYKERRRETENRIKHTRENLTRIIDIKEELQKQLEKLEKQVKVAQKYKEYQSEQISLSTELKAIKWQNLNTKNSKFDQELSQLTLDIERLRAEKESIENQLVQEKERLHELSDQFDEVVSKQNELNTDIVRLEETKQYRLKRKDELAQELKSNQDELVHFQSDSEQSAQRLSQLIEEIKEAEASLTTELARLGDIELEFADIEQKYSDVLNEWESIRGEQLSLEKQTEVLATRQKSVQTRLDDTNRTLQSLNERPQDAPSIVDEEISAIRGQMSQIDDQLAEIEQSHVSCQEQGKQISSDIQQNQQALKASTQQVNEQKQSLSALNAMQALALREKQSISEELTNRLSSYKQLGERITVAEGWEIAVETVLKNQIQSYCVDDLSDFLHDATLSDVGFLTGSTDEAQSTLPAGCLSQYIKTDVLTIYQFTNKILPVANLSEGYQTLHNLDKDYSVITQDGQWLGHGWLRTRDSKIAQDSVLVREEEIKAAQSSLQEMTSIMEQHEATEASLSESLTINRKELDVLTEKRGILTTEKASLRSKIETIEENQNKLLEQQQQLAALITTNQEIRDKAEIELAEINSTLNEKSDALSQINSQEYSIRESKESLSSVVNTKRAELTQLKDTVNNKQMSLESKKSTESSTRAHLERTSSYKERVEEKLKSLTMALDELSEPGEDLDSKLSEKLNLKSLLDKQVAELRQKKEYKSTEIETLELSRDDNFEQTQTVSDKTNQINLKREEFVVRAQTLVEELGLDTEAIKQVVLTLPEGFDEQTWSERLARIERKLERLGPINLAAIEEFETESERMTYLQSQQDDLEDALNTLEDAISKIDKETKVKFKETFDEVNKHIQTLFPILFGGGSAHLELTDADLLEAGVAIHARPPGKKNNKIHSLSGGEKTLTAISLVFSFFQLSPAPFCMLDEVDAPLDDANVSRYCTLIKKMSEKIQFIFITHNKVTMELAEQLGGVTMNEPGISRLVSVDIQEAMDVAVA